MKGLSKNFNLNFGHKSASSSNLKASSFKTTRMSIGKPGLKQPAAIVSKPSLTKTQSSKKLEVASKV